MLLAMLLGLHLGADVLMLVVASSSRDLATAPLALTYTVLFGVTTSQPVLLTMWAVFLRDRLGLRVVLPCLILFIIVVEPFVLLPSDWHRVSPGVIPTYLGYQAALFGMSGALFLLTRSVLKWGIVPTEVAEDASGRDSCSKLSLADLFGLTAFCALGLAGLRVYGADVRYVALPLAHDAVHALAALAFIPLCLLDRQPPQKYRWPLRALAADLAFSVAITAYRGSALVVVYWLCFAAGFFGSVGFSLWIARVVGYRLSLPESSATERTAEDASGKAGG
jgi:hypothetical protein